MTVVQSLGTLAEYGPHWLPKGAYGSVRMYDKFNHTYARLYREQPNVRVCVDFLARNIAQLGLHVYRRVSETDRERLRDHGLARTLSRPNPFTTRYRLVNALVSDLGVYDNAYWLKMRGPDGGVVLLRVPPELVTVRGGLGPTAYEINLGAKVLKPTPEQIVHFRGYNPESTITGLSPLETLRRILAEEHAMGDYREHFWQNAARMNGVIERPAEAPDWDDTARERFKQEFEALYSGSLNSGKTAILEEGMTWKQTSFSAQESELDLARKLTREECARAYHIPLPLVGILDHATFSNVKEQHKHLYQDCLGPINAMLEEDIILQLLPEYGDSEGVYVEFNIAEKLQGSFEEQAQSFSTMVGRPVMTANEGRARLNLPRDPDPASDQLVVPLNVLVGGQASPRDSAPKSLPQTKAAGEVIDPSLLDLRAQHVAKWRRVLAKFFGRQGAAMIGRVRDDSALETVWQDGERWDRELTADLLALNTLTATTWGRHVAGLVQADLDEARMMDYLATRSARAAEGINRTTQAQIGAALLAEVPKDAVKGVFETAQEARAEGIAQSGVTSAANFGSHEGARQGGLRQKVWQAQFSADPREEHQAMNGETVAIGDLFSNGARWPGDPVLGAEGNNHCHCTLGFRRE